MNDLSNKGEADFEDNVIPENSPHVSQEALYKKLAAYLLLLYQSYLRKETRLEADIKASLFRMVQFNQDYAQKIRIMQMDYMNRKSPISEGEWNEGSEVLFPIEKTESLVTISYQEEKTIMEYKKNVSDLLVATY